MLTLSTVACTARSEVNGGDRNLSWTNAAGGGPAGTGEHDSLDSWPPRQRASGEEREDDVEQLVVASAGHGVVGGDGMVRRRRGVSMAATRERERQRERERRGARVSGSSSYSRGGHGREGGPASSGRSSELHGGNMAPVAPLAPQ